MEDSSPDTQRDELVEYAASDSKWLKFNALCLDGGGVRGLWTLYVLKALMEAIADIEAKDKYFHSFCPLSWPLELASDLSDEEKKKKIDAGNNEERKSRAIYRHRRYLPCHYFDYICGSSTGALIAIMLGRLRMTVADCITEYENLAQTIFGRPRFFIAMRFAIGSRPKYDHKAAEKVFQDVVQRRNHQSPGERFAKVRFPMGRGACATFVTSLKSEDLGFSSILYLIRSYDHEQRTRVSIGDISQRRAPTGLSNPSMATPKPQNRKATNYETAQDFEIWQVARAATAANFYFKPWEIRDRDQSILLTDGGFSEDNNPTEKAREEIEELKGTGSTDVIVSIGTARGPTRERTRSVLSVGPRFLKKVVAELTDPEAVHGRMEKAQQKSAQPFEYHRFNHASKLQVELDEWQPRKRKKDKASGSETMAAIRNDVNAYLNEEGVKRDIDDCAAKLVKRRQDRSCTQEWERYATVAVYRCRRRGCDFDVTNDRAFEDHLRREHLETDPDDLNVQLDDCRRQWQYQENNVGRS